MLEGWFFIAAALLVVSGGAKLVDPDPTLGALEASGLPHGRWAAPAIGVTEIGVGVLGTILGGGASLGVAAVYASFAAFVGWALVRRLPIASCGCFGRPDTPPTWGHAVFNLTSATVALVVALSGSAPLDVLAGQPLLALPYLAFVALGVYVVYLLLAVLPLTLAAGRRS